MLLKTLSKSACCVEAGSRRALLAGPGPFRKPLLPAAGASRGSSSMSWLWTFGSVPELEAPAIQEVSNRIGALKPEERAAPGAPRIIDVRTEAEYQGGHVAHAVNASFLPPWSFASRMQPLLEGVSKDAQIVCICLSAHRSIGALKWLNEQGYTNVKQLAGGMKDWRARGLPEVQ